MAMRRVRYLVAASLDGFIADANGKTDWITIDPELDFGALFSQFDTILVGRRTFEETALFGGAALFQSLADVHLVDTVEVSLIPVILGSGVPLFGGSSKALKLSLTGHKVYQSTGIVVLEYAPN